jgi:hypothetical protein
MLVNEGWKSNEKCNSSYVQNGQLVCHECWFTLAIGGHCEPLKKVQRQTLATRLSLGAEDS